MTTLVGKQSQSHLIQEIPVMVMEKQQQNLFFGAIHIHEQGHVHAHHVHMYIPCVDKSLT